MHQLMLNLTTVTDQHSSQDTNSADTSTKLNAPTGVNLTTVADQFHPKKHTYQTKHTNRSWT